MFALRADATCPQVEGWVGEKRSASKGERFLSSRPRANEPKQRETAAAPETSDGRQCRIKSKRRIVEQDNAALRGKGGVVSCCLPCLIQQAGEKRCRVRVQRPRPA